VVVDGTYAQNELFLQKLQNAVTRAFLVQHLSIAVLDTPSLSNSTPVNPPGNLLRSTINGEIFVLQSQASAVTGNTAGAPTTTTVPAS
jgi:hypothetical protein